MYSIGKDDKAAASFMPNMKRFESSMAFGDRLCMSCEDWIGTFMFLMNLSSSRLESPRVSDTRPVDKRRRMSICHMRSSHIA